MVDDLLRRGCDVTVVTTPPYYPQWKIAEGFRKWGWWSDATEPRLKVRKDELGDHGERRLIRGRLKVIRCPLWVPDQVSGLKRIIHLASFGLSSVPAVIWSAIRLRPDVVMTVEPAAFCMPTTWLAARLCGAKAWLHVQDFEVDAAFELGILKQPILKTLVLAVEAFLMRRFDRVSTISTSMIDRLATKGVDTNRTYLFPNWVDCEAMRPLENPHVFREQFQLPIDKCIALYAGNIGAKQGLELVVEAARRAVGSPDIRFVICGHGAAFPSIEAAIRSGQMITEPMALATGDALNNTNTDGTKHAASACGSGDRRVAPAASADGSGKASLSNLTLLPVQPFEIFNQLMNCADIHLLPQRADAADLVMPSKLTGMLATGRPVVACASPGTQVAQVVAGRGCVVPPGDAVAFTESVMKLAADPAERERLGKAAREYALDHLGKAVILDLFFRELQSVASVR